MTEQLNECETRVLRLQQLKDAGVIPYANRYDKTHSCADLIEIGSGGQVSDADVLMDQGAKQLYSTAGRMMAFRTMGKLSFATLRDATGDIQIAFVKELCHFHTGKEVVDVLDIADQETNVYKFAEKFLDIGDFVGVKGELFITKHGELTLFVDEYQLLSKALRPLGDKRHGVKDEEKIYRQRYLDMTMNEESYQRFLFKTDFYTALRAFYVSQGFQEIVTSVLGNAASGAAAKPFITHHNDYDLDVYLRIAFEPALKMATVGRYEKVFEIGKDFRNEGSDPSHVQEFTQVEHYAARWNYEDNMKFAEDMFDYLFVQLQLPKTTQVKDKEGNLKDVDRSTPRERIDYIAGVKKASGGIDITQYENTDKDQKKLVKDIQEKGFSREGMEKQGVTTLIDYLYKKILRPHIIGPAFVYNYPKTMQPLARQNDANPDIVEQFQVVVNGREIIKAYSELIDPTIQQANFDEQALALEKGDEEATSGDADFLLAMEHGMPCQSGFGMGLERILALLTQQDNLRDVIMFPLMKPVREEIEWGHEKGIINKYNIDTENNITKGELIRQCVIYMHTNLGLNIDYNIPCPYIDIDGNENEKYIKIAYKLGILPDHDYEGNSFNPSQYGNTYYLIIVLVKSINIAAGEPERNKLAEIKLIQDGIDLGIILEKTLLNVYITEDASNDIIYRCRYDNPSSININDMLQKIDRVTQKGELLKTDYGNLPTKDQVHDLVEKYLTDTKRHCEQVGAIMQWFAKKLGEDEHLRYIAGLLHDIDRDHIAKDADRHLKNEFEMIMAEISASPALIDDIKSHGEWLTGVPVDSLIRKYLAAVDELSGFMYAYSLMRPTHFDGMQAKGVKKRIKDKSFAAGVDREHLMNCEKYLEIPLGEFVSDMIKAFESIKR